MLHVACCRLKGLRLGVSWQNKGDVKFPVKLQLIALFNVSSLQSCTICCEVRCSFHTAVKSNEPISPRLFYNYLTMVQKTLQPVSVLVSWRRFTSKPSFTFSLKVNEAPSRIHNQSTASDWVHRLRHTNLPQSALTGSAGKPLLSGDKH